MAIKPILFSTPMVEAILNGSKTETRRIVKYKKEIENPKIGFSTFCDAGQFEVRGLHKNGEYGISFFKLPIQKGDILWVRETWQITDFLHPTDDNYGYIYKASQNGREWQENTKGWTWKPSIFMPKEACRLFLEVTDVKIQRLLQITEKEAEAEGIIKYGENSYYDYEDPHMFLTRARHSFFTLWDSINVFLSSIKNPYVFVYQFKITEQPKDFLK